MVKSSEAAIHQKAARLEAARTKLQQFMDGGGNLKSPEAAPLGVEFLHAYDDLAREFGYEILKPINQELVNAGIDSQHTETQTDRKLKSLEAVGSSITSYYFDLTGTNDVLATMPGYGIAYFVPVLFIGCRILDGDITNQVDGHVPLLDRDPRAPHILSTIL